MTLASCEKRVVILAGDGGKTPVEFAVAVKSSINEYPQTKAGDTKAYDNKFENNDVLWTYLQHVGPDSYTGFGRLCKIDVKTTSAGPINNWSGNRALVANDMYWDDFMDVDHDIRTSGHGLQSKYAYCFNGGTPVPNLASGATDDQKAAGVVTWTVQTSQNASGNFKKSDLLYSKTQERVTYVHSYSSALNGEHGYVNLPFYHAMSKITVEIVGGESFKGSTKPVFDETSSVILKNVNTSCTVSAPDQTLSGYTTAADVTMQKESKGTATKRSFTALIAPTVIKGGADAQHAIEFATLNNIGGYNFSLKLTQAALETKPAGSAFSWKDKLTDYDATSVSPASPCGQDHYTSADGGRTIPGVNYLITVTVERTGIEVVTTIVDWDKASASEEGQIIFEQDITASGTIDEELKAGGFDIYARSTEQSSYGGVASIVTWDPTGGEDGTGAWLYNPQLYWPSGTYQSYFRALAPSGSSDTQLEASDFSAVKDVLWGTTAKEPGYYEQEGMAIKPRTGKVPLNFYHAMAKVTFNLFDANNPTHEASPGHSQGHGHGHGHGADPYLNLAGAKIALYNLAGTGTLDLHTGTTTPGERLAPMVADYYAANDSSVPAGSPVLKDYLVIPQAMGDGAYAEITLADGTRYKLDLKYGVSETTSGEYGVFSTWRMGTEYIYNVFISKQAITFRALIKAWDRVEGSGLADLEWD